MSLFIPPLAERFYCIGMYGDSQGVKKLICCSPKLFFGLFFGGVSAEVTETLNGEYVRAMYRDYQVHGDKLWEKFNNPDPKAQGEYCCSLANAFRKDDIIRETPAFKEYAALCAEVFHAERDQDENFIV